MKKILILAPILSEWSNVDIITESLQFLVPYYELNIIDPLVNVTMNTTEKVFFEYWEEKIRIYVTEYDAFFGFSLGGVILQKFFPIFEVENKAVVLFSVPSFVDILLANRLNSIIKLIEKDELSKAIMQINRYVFYPKYVDQHEIKLKNPKETSVRLLKGFRFIIDIDSRPVLKSTKLKYLHLIGEKSQLVNYDNVYVPLSCQLILVPQSGMRVLENNQMYCVDPIIELLEEKLT